MEVWWKGRNEEKEWLTEGVERRCGRELKDEERDGTLPYLLDGRGEKRKRINPILFQTRRGQVRTAGTAGTTSSSLVLLGSEQRKGPPRPETTPEQKRYRPRVSKSLGMTQAGRLLAKRPGWAGNSARNRNLRAVWVREGSQVPVPRGVPLWILVGPLLLSKPALMQGGQL